MELEIIIPIFNEQSIIDELHNRVSDVCDRLEDFKCRIIYINDGSNDNSLDILLEKSTKDPRMRIIDLSRNFGHQSAIAAGLAYSDADAVVLMDGDLQDPPEIIPDIVAKWREGAQVVIAERRSRKEKGLRRIGFELFHRMFSIVSDFPVQPNTGIFGLMDREAVKELNDLSEKNRFFPGLRSWIGFKQETVYYDRLERSSGKPKQSYKRLFRYAFDAVFSFSYKPLRIMTLAGIAISSVSFSIALFFIIRRLSGIEIAQTGFTTLVTLILFLGGVQLIAIGLLGEYLARVYDEVKKRPLFIIKKRHGYQMEASPEDQISNIHTNGD